jgi:lipoate-protein ligase A
VTYSLTAPVPDRVHRQLGHWYDLCHAAWIEALSVTGVNAHLCPRTDPDRESAFLCFQRRTAGDLLIEETKIGGSAQRRHQAAALQHGSLLLERSPAAPELPGIAEMSPQELVGVAWRDTWIEEIAARLNVVWEPGAISDEESDLATTLRREKFGNSQWTLRR